MTDDIVDRLKAGHSTQYNAKLAYEEIERLRVEVAQLRAESKRLLVELEEHEAATAEAERHAGVLRRRLMQT